jgi:hypothetical protein
MHPTTLQLVSKRTVYDKLLNAVCGVGTHIKIVDRPCCSHLKRSLSTAGDH